MKNCLLRNTQALSGPVSTITTTSKPVPAIISEDLSDAKLQNSNTLYCILDAVLYCNEMLDASIFTWSEDLGERFAEYVESREFKNSVIRRKWVIDINLLERVAKDEVIRGYFSDGHDESSASQDILNFSTLKVDL